MYGCHHQPRRPNVLTVTEHERCVERERRINSSMETDTVGGDCSKKLMGEGWIPFGIAGVMRVHESGGSRDNVEVLTNKTGMSVSEVDSKFGYSVSLNCDRK